MLALRPWVSSWKRRAHSAFMPAPMRAGAIASSGACCTSIGFPTIRPTAVVVHAHVARAEARRKEDVDAFGAAEATLEGCPVVDIGDRDLRTRFGPRLPLGGAV